MKILKCLVVVITLGMLPHMGLAQNLFNSYWIVSISNPTDTTGSGKFGTSHILFDDNIHTTFKEQYNLRHLESAITISNKEGDLLFLSNGYKILNHNNELIENGDSLGYGSFFDIYKDNGNPMRQGIIALPLGDQDSVWGLFHTTARVDSQFVVDRILFSELNMSSNNLKGKVTTKNDTIALGSYAPQLAATRHGNGTDWWVIGAEHKSNCYEVMLYDSLGALHFSNQCLGLVAGDSSFFSQTTFSPEGNLFVRYNTVDDLQIFKFNRCTGELHDPIQIVVKDVVDSIGGIFETGVMFSPNGRYIYLGSVYELWQVDLTLPLIQENFIRIAKHDFSLPVEDRHSFGAMTSASNGWIAIYPLSIQDYYHLIKFPDKPGDNAGVIFEGLKFPTYNNFTMMNYPNYNLGSVNCDSLIMSSVPTLKQNEVSLFPNPCSHFINVELGNELSRPKSIIDKLGRSVLTLEREFNRSHKIDIRNLHSDAYFIVVENTNRKIFAQRFVIIR